MDRRKILTGFGSAVLATALPRTGYAQDAQVLIPIRFSPSEIFRTTVCLRPFRAAGPRIEAEDMGRKRIVHNYGHGGAGWSLSWGSAEAAVKLAMENRPKSIAVIGAGAIGLTTALMAQRAGAQVTIYAKERFPDVRSARATGTWSPDSRAAKTDAVATDFADRWEHMARRSWTMHQSYVGLAGNPVEWMDHYYLRNPQPPVPDAPTDIDPGFLYLERRLGDIVPSSHPVSPDQHRFNAEQARRRSVLTFNIAALSHQLTEDFLIAGGRFVPMTFETPSDLNRLKEKVIINCTGYGARALFKDDSITPVRGQIVWLPPQEGVHYGLMYKGVFVVARRDGIVVQALGPNENFGWNDDNEQPDMAAAHATLAALSDVFKS
ncbi:FAD-dependent oxidoreductase [Asticcacaulis sp. ZE23SCel15]|uniref:FAD-dependent oxidoreductase n=1 Tax=Asticcacaulis sp. ZE23SCel15 TaxID=3059027 RepID=UPI00265D9A42|nr:FAD-dependent oxidoreductase [Asticcacaulis sp. ZE23SCel15]WKL55853.1 FAD-dependent oxidoreductase [Asticcacaulis sp. ZE23SCel15]